MQMLINILILVVAVVIGMGIYVFRAQHQARKAVRGHVWATFYSDTGARYEELCPVEGNRVTAPSAAKERTGNETYILETERTYNTLYPPGKPAPLQVTVRHAAFHESVPEAIEPRGNGKSLLTSDQLYNMLNSQASQLMLKTSEELAQYVEQFNRVLNPKFVYYGLAAIGIGVVIVGYYTYNTAASVQRLLTLLGG